ncbi:hypothetical protein [Salipaludibacillus daqingensis]|uniref:hypothetical protein n=1 Tax=Salipaludibacillus daqingensis TaxID=3041001 RepID=UPI002473A1FE|nr:hypothetical protein [Salipaludibacillus daqingensis]
MKKIIIKYVVIGCIFTLILGALTVSIASWRIFLLSSVVLGVLAFIPLVVAALSNESAPKPTLYGTSAPNKYTTIKVNEGKKQNKKLMKWGIRFACIGVPLMLSFFIFSILTLQ